MITCPGLQEAFKVHVKSFSSGLTALRKMSISQNLNANRLARATEDRASSSSIRRSIRACRSRSSNSQKMSKESILNNQKRFRSLTGELCLMSFCYVNRMRKGCCRRRILTRKGRISVDTRRCPKGRNRDPMKNPDVGARNGRHYKSVDGIRRQNFRSEIPSALLE